MSECTSTHLSTPGIPQTATLLFKLWTIHSRRDTEIILDAEPPSRRVEALFSNKNMTYHSTF